jgi:hypothetical protein
VTFIGSRGGRGSRGSKGSKGSRGRYLGQVFREIVLQVKNLYFEQIIRFYPDLLKEFNDYQDEFDEITALSFDCSRCCFSRLNTGTGSHPEKNC